jgi:hypothetical protein
MRYHYVVLVAWQKGVVLLHDPARAPFQVVSVQKFHKAWAATGQWSLLVLPDNTPSQVGSAEVDTLIADRDSEGLPSGTFASLVAEGVRFGRANDLDAAEMHFKRPQHSGPILRLHGASLRAFDFGKNNGLPLLYWRAVLRDLIPMMPIPGCCWGPVVF